MVENDSGQGITVWTQGSSMDPGGWMMPAGTRIYLEDENHDALIVSEQTVVWATTDSHGEYQHMTLKTDPATVYSTTPTESCPGLWTKPFG